MLLVENWLVIIFSLCKVSAAIKNEFPKDFLFGVSTSSYQIEGAWNISGNCAIYVTLKDKGENIWDHHTHTRPDLFANGHNGDVAADSYHKYKEDIQLIKSIGANIYRFSLSWSRILPDGYDNRISKDGVQYYNDLINECISNGIVPLVTIYHWDLPQKLQDHGGWANSNIMFWFEKYARLVFRLFGDRVKMWTTINEPNKVCAGGYGNHAHKFAPLINQSGIADYLCGHHVLLAHARTYAMYRREFHTEQNGKVGITLDCDWYEPADNTFVADIKAAERYFDFHIGWFAHPLFSLDGDYPRTMKTRIAVKSNQQGFKRSRLPVFTSEQIRDIKHSCDFIGINYYTSFIAHYKTYDNMGFLDDAGSSTSVLKEWKGIGWCKNTPWGLRKILQTMTAKYQLPDIYITENGYLDHGGLQDVDRVTYLHDHLQELLSVIQNGIDVKGYMVWSLLDSFEWESGYKVTFGLFNVDFNRTDRLRTPKLSSKFIAETFKTSRIPDLSNYVQA